MFSEDNLLPLAALQHLVFCERQCALIHIEQAWDENRLTVEGRILHEKVHEGENESRGDLRIARGVRLRSLRLGLTGVADVVEFHRLSANLESQISQPQADPPVAEDLKSAWRPYPVEFKRGRPKPDDSDKVQLCAQAMCLEEMLLCSIAEGALFYGRTRRRHNVAFDEALRRTVEETARKLHDLIDSGRTPPATYAKKCDNCSLAHVCLPETAGAGKSADKYLRSEIPDLT